MARRDVLVVLAAIAVGTIVGGGASFLYGRADGPAYLLAAEGRWLALAWGAGVLAARPWAAASAGGALIAAILVAFEVVPFDGFVEAARRAGGDVGAAQAAADTLDGERVIGWRLALAGGVVGAGAAAWRSRGARRAILGAGLLCGALMYDAGSDLVRGFERPLPGIGPTVEPTAVVFALLAIPASVLLLDGRRRVLGLLAGIAVAAALVGLAPVLDSAPQLQVIK